MMGKKRTKMRTRCGWGWVPNHRVAKDPERRSRAVTIKNFALRIPGHHSHFLLVWYLPMFTRLAIKTENCLK